MTDQIDIQTMLNELNPQQRQAAETIYGPVLVLAGAGSGKTKTMTVRIANMLSQGIGARSMFVATFTNKAAKEMRDRITKAVGEEAVKALWMGTFHSLCVKILRQYGHHLGYKTDEKGRCNFSIYDTGDSLKLVERIYKALNLEDKYKAGLALHYIDNAKNNLWTPEHCLYHNASTPTDEAMSIVYQHFQEIMKEANAMDFGDLIMNVVTLLEDHDEVREKLQSRFQYVFSDEYQDANHAQFKLLQLLAFPQNNIFVVGDDYQAIYGFRGSDVHNILSFERQFFPCSKILLEQNYRSKEVIVEAGNAVISNNSIQMKKVLKTDKKGGNPITIVETEQEHKEAAFVTYWIQKMVKEGKYKYGDFAILYRTNNQSAPFEQLFMHAMIPHKVVGGTGFFQREEIKDLVAYLRVLYNRKDDAAMLRILNKPTRGIGKTSQDHIEKYATDHRVSIHRALKTAEDIPTIKSSTANKIKDFLELLDFIQQRENADITRFVRYVLDVTGYYKMWETKSLGRGKDAQEAQERMDNINEFLRLVERYKLENPDKDLTEFMQEISLLMDFDSEKGEKENVVKLMSIHASKGLEFPAVFIVGCNEGIFPSNRSMSGKDLEEERRLMYVGITRAEFELFLTYTTQRTNYKGGLQPSRPSRFLDELPDEIVRRHSLVQNI